jgi:hypothetical protein
MKKITSGSKLIKRANQLQKEVKLILDKLGLLNILKEIFEPKIVGSAANCLMLMKDIDIHTYMKESDMEKILIYFRNWHYYQRCKKFNSTITVNSEKITAKIGFSSRILY